MQLNCAFTRLLRTRRTELLSGLITLPRAGRRIEKVAGVCCVSYLMTLTLSLTVCLRLVLVCLHIVGLKRTLRRRPRLLKIVKNLMVV